MNLDIPKLLSELTEKEKISLTTGEGNWNTKTVQGSEIPVVRMQDGPHGLRFVEGDSNDMSGGSKPTVCFPSEALSAASFDRELLYEMGKELGEECQAENVQLLLGPGVNIKRNPLCGRNFEYYSEDPFLAGELGAAFIKGIQEQGVGACVKHFFANSQEYRRMSSSSNMDERTARELYLAAFERIIRKAKPWAVMAAYNRVDGTFCTEKNELLTGVLREEWGYQGIVISDWGAVHNRTAAIEAGCDLTMPGEDSDKKVIQAWENGRLSGEMLDQAAGNVLKLAVKAAESHKEGQNFDYEKGHALAHKIAAQSIVLLKNEDKVLPLGTHEKIAFIGGFAKEPRYQGSGSSRIHSREVDSALNYAEKMFPDVHIEFALGYRTDEPEEEWIAEAQALAGRVDKAVIFAGLSELMESEGYDRSHMRMPESHNELIQRVCEVQPNTIVVLHNGAPVEMPWIGQVKGVVETYLGGEAAGGAVADVLFGRENPSGRLPESFPERLEDNPSYLCFGGELGQVNYNERMFVGYRYYSSVGRRPLFPFGYGLSYTDYSYGNLCVDTHRLTEEGHTCVTVDVTNSGSRAGKEVVQLYVAPPEGELRRPVRELKGFEKIALEPGETKRVSFQLEYRDFACYSPLIKGWYAAPGTYRISIGASADRMLLTQEVSVEGKELPMTDYFDEGTLIKDFVLHPVGRKFFEEHFAAMMYGMSAAGLFPQEMAEQMLQAGAEKGMESLLTQSVSLLLDFSGVTEEERENLFADMNQ